MQTFKQYLKENHPQMDAKQIINTLALYIHSNKKTTDFDAAYHAALNLYPKYVYNGVMYRAVRLKPDQSPDDPQLLQQVENSPNKIRSWTTSKNYANHPSPKSYVAVLRQTSSGLDINRLVAEVHPQTHGVPFHNLYAYEQEILSPTSSNVELIAVVPPEQGLAPYSG